MSQEESSLKLGMFIPKHGISLKTNQWYLTNKKDFDYLVKAISEANERLANEQDFSYTVNLITKTFKNNQKLYIRVMLNPVRFNYRSEFNDKYMDSYADISEIFPKPYTTLKAVDDNWDAFEHWVDANPDMQGRLGAPLYGPKTDNKVNEEEKVMDNKEKLDNINGILKRYYDEAITEFSRQRSEALAKVACDDPLMKSLKTLDEAFAARDKERMQPHCSMMPSYVYTQAQLEERRQIDEHYEYQKEELIKICGEVRNLCMLCDTYEQIKTILVSYEIIAPKKRGK